MKIGILDDYLQVALEYAPFKDLEPEHQLSIFSAGIAGEKLIETLQAFDVLLVMRERTAFPADIIEQLPNLKLIITTGRRNDVIDMEACKSAGITVCGTDSPGYGTAELTFALILAAAKGVITEHNHMRVGGWQSGLAGNLKGRTLGVMGLGRLGGMVAGYAQVMDMNVIAWSTNLTRERTGECGVKFVSKEELMSQSDFMTIHLRLSDHTHHLVKAKDLSMMKDGSWI
ncbi:MAG: D-2-hydroxyacid dehydrogenase family protein, partial [Gammaproteobacteria bacterium]|nr:D-2-hydroxyacid dehydrogenase family protein [Gammaproteobacteria bacterium]